MLVVAVVTLLCLVVAGLVLFYVAYPHRGEAPPERAEWLGDVLTRAVDSMPTLPAEADDAARTGDARALADR